MEQKPAYTTQSDNYDKWDSEEGRNSPERQKRLKQEKDKIGETAVRASAQAAEESQSVANVDHEAIGNAKELKKLADVLGVSEEYLINAEAATDRIKSSLVKTTRYADETNQRLMQIANLGADADVISNTGAAYDSLLNAYGVSMGVNERQQVGLRAVGYSRIIDSLTTGRQLTGDDIKAEPNAVLRRAVEQTNGNPADLPMAFLVETQVDNELQEQKGRGRELSQDEIDAMRQNIRTEMHRQITDDANFIGGDARRAEEFYDGTARRIGAVDPGGSDAAKIAFTTFDEDYSRNVAGLSGVLSEFASGAPFADSADVNEKNIVSSTVESDGRDNLDANDDGEVKNSSGETGHKKSFQEILGDYRKEMNIAIEAAKNDVNVTKDKRDAKSQRNHRDYETRLKRLRAAKGVIFGNRQFNDPEATMEAKKIVAQMAVEGIDGEEFADEYLRRYDVALKERKVKALKERRQERYYKSREKDGELSPSGLDDLEKWEKAEQAKDAQKDKDFVDGDIANYKPTPGYMTPDQMAEWIKKRDDARDLAKTEGAAFRGVDTNGDPIEDKFATEKGDDDTLEVKQTEVASEQPTGDPGLAKLAQKKSNASEQNPAAEPKPDYNPMAAISIDRTFDIQQLSRAEAQRRLNQELEDNVEGKGFFGRVRGKLKNMWKGNMARGYYETKYQQEELKKLSGLENIDLKESDIQEKAKTDPRYALVMRMIQDNDAYVRSTAGENRQLIDPAKIDEQLKDESLSPERRAELENQKKAYESIRNAIADFSTKGEDGKYLMDESSFNEAMKRADAMLHGDVDDEARATLTNYMAIAKYVRGQAEHGEGVEQVMEGFKLYTAESRANVNGEVKMGKVAAMAEKLNKMPFLRRMPPEWIAAATSAAANTMPFVAKSAAKAIPLVGGMLVTGTLAGAREAANISKDRATLERQLAEGGQNVDGKMNRELAKTMYDTSPAQDQIDAMNEALESGDISKMGAALGDYLARQEIGDRKGVDLFSYSDKSKIDLERSQMTTARLTLEAALIKAAKATGEQGVIDWAMGMAQSIKEQVDMVEQYESDSAKQAFLDDDDHPDATSYGVEAIYRDILAKDKKFNDIKRKAVMRQGLKAGLFAGVSGVAAQEIFAAFSPDAHGVIDQLRGNADNAGAHDTLLTGAARHFGLIDQATAAAPDVSASANHIEAKSINHDLTPEEIAKYKAQGYDVDKVVNQVHQTVTESVPADQAVQGNADFHRAGWFTNDTSSFDHNELTTYNNGDSMTFDPARESWIGNDVLSVDSIRQMGGNGQIRLMLSASDATQGKPFEVVGKLVDGKIKFNPEPGSAAAEMIANRSYKFAEVVDANNMVIGTDVGSGVSGNLPISTDKLVDQVSYNLTKVTPNVQPAVETVKTPFDMPAVFPALFGRRNLRNTIRGEASSGDNTEQGGGEISANPNNSSDGDNGANPNNDNNSDDQPTQVIPPIGIVSDQTKESSSTNDVEIKLNKNPEPLNENEQAVMAAADIANRVMRHSDRNNAEPNSEQPQTINLDDIHADNTGEQRMRASLQPRTSSEAQSAEAADGEVSRAPSDRGEAGQNSAEAKLSANHDAIASAINRGLADEKVRDSDWWNGIRNAMANNQLTDDDVNRLIMPDNLSDNDPNLASFRVNAIQSGRLSDSVIDILSRSNNDLVQQIAVTSGRLSRARLQEMASSDSVASGIANEALRQNHNRQG